jgi:hypothetical protein
MIWLPAIDNPLGTLPDNEYVTVPENPDEVIVASMDCPDVIEPGKSETSTASVEVMIMLWDAPAVTRRTFLFSAIATSVGTFRPVVSLVPSCPSSLYPVVYRVSEGIPWLQAEGMNNPAIKTSLNREKQDRFSS